VCTHTFRPEVICSNGWEVDPLLVRLMGEVRWPLSIMCMLRVSGVSQYLTKSVDPTYIDRGCECMLIYFAQVIDVHQSSGSRTWL